MERRAFIAIVLSLAVLFAYQALSPRPKLVPDTTGQPSPTVGGGPVPVVAADVVPPPTAIAEPGSAGSVIETETRIETKNVIATFTNRGGRLKSWRLKHYRDGKGEPLELIAADLAGSQPLPFTLRAADEVTTALLNGASYTARTSPGAVSIGPITTKVTLSFDFSSGDLAATKAFTFDPDSYTVGFKSQVLRAGVGQSVAVLWGPGLGDSYAQNGHDTVKPGALYSVAGKVSRVSSSGISKQPYHQQVFEYAGIDDHYFTSFVLNPGLATVQYSNLSIPAADGSGSSARELVSYSVTPSTADAALIYYVGPKDFDTLAEIDRNLTKAIDFGMFAVIVVPLLRSLQWIHGYVGNFGWAITILTVLINVVLFPLNHKSVVSMRRMQEVQPEAKAIQERYAQLKSTDPARQKMNQELMALYKLRGVNPASGCVPILLTLPVFLAFYAMLQTAIELRGAPFVGWIHDLSAPDPVYVLPVLVAASQFVTQWMTPAAGMDPAQQKMMLVMPLVMGFMFATSPAGALIYWLVSGVWRIGQMQLTNYMIGPPRIPVAQSAGERRAKKVGRSKTDAAARGE
ncbi:MAG: membrane protein insertase YidC [Vicinamibacterales bacterium]